MPEYSAQARFSTLGLVPGKTPLRDQALRRYAAQLPANFGVVVEAHSSLTVPRLTRAAGSTRGQVRANPRFLNHDFFCRELWYPATNCLGDRLHWMLLAFPPQLVAAGIPPGAFAERLERFLRAVPNPARCAIEVCEPALLTLEYARVLASTGAAHVFSTAPLMPSFAEQARWAPTTGETIFCLRDATCDQYPSNTERRLALVDRLMEGPERRAIVLVANRAEGSAPETIDRLMKLAADRFALEPDVALAGDGGA